MALLLRLTEAQALPVLLPEPEGALLLLPLLQALRLPEPLKLPLLLLQALRLPVALWLPLAVLQALRLPVALWLPLPLLQADVLAVALMLRVPLLLRLAEAQALPQLLPEAEAAPLELPLLQALRLAEAQALPLLLWLALPERQALRVWERLLVTEREALKEGDTVALLHMLAEEHTEPLELPEAEEAPLGLLLLQLLPLPEAEAEGAPLVARGLLLRLPELLPQALRENWAVVGMALPLGDTELEVDTVLLGDSVLLVDSVLLLLRLAEEQAELLAEREAEELTEEQAEEQLEELAEREALSEEEPQLLELPEALLLEDWLLLTEAESEVAPPAGPSRRRRSSSRASSWWRGPGWRILVGGWGGAKVLWARCGEASAEKVPLKRRRVQEVEGCGSAVAYLQMGNCQQKGWGGAGGGRCRGGCEGEEQRKMLQRFNKSTLHRRVPNQFKCCLRSLSRKSLCLCLVSHSLHLCL